MYKNKSWFLALCAFFMLGVQLSRAAKYVVNYDEDKVPQFVLPDPLTFANGKKLMTPQEWKQRRAELLELFQDQMYGFMPERPMIMRYELTESGTALAGLAQRRQVTIWFTADNNPDSPHINILLYTPANQQPAPAFLGLNFAGNHGVSDDQAVAVASCWLRNNEKTGVANNQASEKGRGQSANRWQVEYLIKQGFALATACYGDIDPDFHDGFFNGVHALYPESKPRANHAWGTISAWAWGLSRIMDYLQTIPELINPGQVAVMGHSRLGKTSLLAGAMDERFALVISNNSGCGGAALSKRCFGETIEIITRAFPHWFCTNFTRYAGREADLPFDQHMIMACVAPRALYVASAVEDRWADPRGEFLGLKNAAAVHRFLGVDDFSGIEFPEIDKPVYRKRTGYHCRSGKHDVTLFDWECYVKFARQLYGL